MTKIPKQQTTWSALDFLENSEQETNAQKSELERRAELRRKLAAEQAKKESSIITTNDKQDQEIQARREKARKEVQNRTNYEKEQQRILSQNRPLMPGQLSGTGSEGIQYIPGTQLPITGSKAKDEQLLRTAKLYEKDQPLSATDPVGLFFVEGTVLGKPLELAGKGLWAGAKLVAPKTTSVISSGVKFVGNAIKDLASKGKSIVKTPKNYFTTARSVYNTGNLSADDAVAAAKEGILEAFKSYSPGGAWYERQLANGIPKKEVETMAQEFRFNLGNAFNHTQAKTIKGDAVALTVGGTDAEGNILAHTTRIDVDPRFATSKEAMKEVGTHEAGGHSATMNYEPKGSSFVEDEFSPYYKIIGKENPQTVKAMEHNMQIRPQVKESAVDEIINGGESTMQHYNNIAPEQEIRARAFTAEVDARNKGMSIDEYLDTPSAWNLNMKQLQEIFTPESIKQYMHGFKTALVPLSASTYGVQKLSTTQRKFGGKLNYLNYVNS